MPAGTKGKIKTLKAESVQREEMLKKWATTYIMSCKNSTRRLYVKNMCACVHKLKICKSLFQYVN